MFDYDLVHTTWCGYWNLPKPLTVGLRAEQALPECAENGDWSWDSEAGSRVKRLDQSRSAARDAAMRGSRPHVCHGGRARFHNGWGLPGVFVLLSDAMRSLINSAPSLHPQLQGLQHYYGQLRPSLRHRYSSSWCLPLVISLCIRNEVLTFRTKACIELMPPIHRLPPRP